MLLGVETTDIQMTMVRLNTDMVSGQVLATPARPLNSRQIQQLTTQRLGTNIIPIIFKVFSKVIILVFVYKEKKYLDKV